MPPRKRAASQEVDGNFQPQRATGGRGNNAAGHGGRGGRGRSGEVGGSTSRVRGPPSETTLIKSLPAALRSGAADFALWHSCNDLKAERNRCHTALKQSSKATEDDDDEEMGSNPDEATVDDTETEVPALPPSCRMLMLVLPTLTLHPALTTA